MHLREMGGNVSWPALPCQSSQSTLGHPVARPSQSAKHEVSYGQAMQNLGGLKATSGTCATTHQNDFDALVLADVPPAHWQCPAGTPAAAQGCCAEAERP